MPKDVPTPAPVVPRPSTSLDLTLRRDPDLAALLDARPDLARPAPTDLVALAARALSPASVRRALDGLDTAHLRTLEAASLGVDTRGVSTALGCPHDRAAALLAALWQQGLVLVDDTDRWFLPRQVAELLGPVAGLAEAHPDDADLDVRDLDPAAPVPDGPPGAADILTRLTWGPASGTVAADGPLREAVRHLVEAGLLRHDGAGTVTLPRPVALALRGGRLTPTDETLPPAAEPRPHPPARVDSGGGTQAGDVLASVEEIGTAWGATPPRVLRAGGLAVRDLALTTGLAGLDSTGTALLIETMWAAGLLGQDPGLEPVWAPTEAYDAWLERPDPLRWAAFVLAWRDMRRAPSLVGTRRDGAGVNALSEAVTVGAWVGLRRRALSVLRDLPAGAAVGADDVVTLLRWQTPRVPVALLEDAARATLAEAELLGVTSAGALTTAGRALLSADATAEDVADGLLLPDTVDHVLLQADLTAVAPGRLDTHAAAFMRLAADVESRGGASTYRFSAAGVRRLLDAGWEVDDILGTLARLSRTGVPQPLDYLVRDAARGHGTARIGAASSYLRSEDTAALDELLARPEAAPVRLRRLAPTVLVSPVAPTQILALLRGLGVHALVESADGTVMSGSSAPTRAPVPRRSPQPVAEAVDVPAVVAALRASEDRRRSGHDAGTAAPTDPAVILAVLRAAVVEGVTVEVGVVGTGGETSTRRVRPTRVAGGLVHGVDVATDRTRTWPLHRLTGATRV